MTTESIARSEVSDHALIDTPEDNFDVSLELLELLESISKPKPMRSASQARQAGLKKEDTCVNQSDPLYFWNDLNKRKHDRLPVHWRAAIINKGIGKNDIYHGRTHDLSLSSVSIFIEHNIFFTSEVVLLLAIPPMHQGKKETIVETQCSTTYTLLDSAHGQFRVGMKIMQFKGDGKAILEDILTKQRTTIEALS
jgi:hypothetical protein